MRPRAAITLAAVVYSIGADFRRAMVATAAGEKLVIGRRGVSNWTPTYDIKLVFVHKITFVLRKINENFLTPICIKSFVGCGRSGWAGGESKGREGSSSLALGRKKVCPYSLFTTTLWCMLL